MLPERSGMPPKRTVLVCGSRDWTDRTLVRMPLALLAATQGYERLIHGAAPGADSIAAKIGEDFGYQVEAFPADWDKHGKAAGPIRNRQMLDEKPDLVLAFQRNGSRGTQDTIDEAQRRGIKTMVVKH